MLKISILILKTAKKIYEIINPSFDSEISGRNWKMFSNKEYSNELIYNYLISDKPCMIARFGSTEMMCLSNYLGVKKQQKKWLPYIKGTSLKWWWETSTINQMKNWSGFFPAKIDKIESFCDLMINEITNVDVLGSWLNEEKFFTNELANTKRLVLEDIEPFFSTNPWTRALKGKRVLVVHPFSDTIQLQYKKRTLLFENELLPEFDLQTLKAVQSVAGERTEFSDWFEALQFMKDQIDKIEYDICIIGCGAYGFPLAAHVKKMGKKSIHLAGVTQLLFGIIGKRWEEFVVWPYTNLFNEHWVRPSKNDRPQNAHIVEGATYW